MFSTSVRTPESWPNPALASVVSRTRFAAAAPEQPVFADALAKHFGGVPDDATLARL